MDFLNSALKKSQEAISGWVELKLYKGNCYVLSRASPSSLYNQDLSSMDVEGGFNPIDSEGFIKINSIRLRAHRVIMSQYDDKKEDEEVKK